MSQVSGSKKEIKPGAPPPPEGRGLRTEDQVEGVVTVQSCEGHQGRGAFIDLQLSNRNWELLNRHAEKILLGSGLADIQFSYYAIEEGTERSLRIRVHPGIIAAACCPVFSKTAKIMKELREQE